MSLNLLRSENARASRGFFAAMVMFCIFGFGLATPVEGGCGAQFVGSARRELSSLDEAGSLKLRMYIDYRGGVMGYTHIPPSMPCDGAGCGAQPKMEPSFQLSVFSRLPMPNFLAREKDRVAERVQRSQLYGQPQSEFAARGGLSVVEPPPKHS
jgi:hypothetical protein